MAVFNVTSFISFFKWLRYLNFSIKEWAHRQHYRRFSKCGLAGVQGNRGNVMRYRITIVHYFNFMKVISYPSHQQYLSFSYERMQHDTFVFLEKRQIYICICLRFLVYLRIHLIGEVFLELCLVSTFTNNCRMAEIFTTTNAIESTTYINVDSWDLYADTRSCPSGDF